MMKMVAVLSSILLIAGCASGGGNSGSSGAASAGGNALVQFSKPTEISQTEFAKDPKKYSKTWVDYNGGGVDSFKKVTIPSYTLEFQTYLQKVNSNKMAALLVKADGAKSALTMGVSFPWQEHQQMMQEIAAASYTRLKEKFKKSGVEVVEWNTVVASNKKAEAFNNERLSNEPVVTADSIVSVSAPGASRLKSGMWQFAASSLSRNAEVSLIFPNFGVGFGYFDGATTPYTVTEAHGMTGVQFTPQIQVYAGSGFSYQSKWDTGVMQLDRTAVANEPFCKKLTKAIDSRQAANESGEVRRSLAMATSGAQAHEVAVSTSARVNYNVEIEAAKYKEALMAQLDAAENLLIERYKNEF